MKKVLLLVAYLLMMAVLALAQEAVEVRATVNYPAVNLRDAPNARNATRWSGTSNVLAVLARNEEVIVQAVETVSYQNDPNYGYTWVYVTVPGRNLSGWVVSEYLTFDRDNWHEFVHQITSWDELLQYTSVRLPSEGIAGKIANSGGQGYYYLPIFDNPIDQNVIANIPIDTLIMSLGRAEVDGEISDYIYIRSNDGLYEGWTNYNYIGEVISNVTFKGAYFPSLDYFQNLPILFEGTTAGDADHPYGVVEITAVNLRSDPDITAAIVRELPYLTHLTLHHTTGYDDEAWIFVTVANTGEQGRVYANYLSYWVSNWSGSHRVGSWDAVPLSQ